MLIIIDGYNILKQLFKENLIGEKKRTWLAHALRDYAKAKGHRIVLVFDGGPSWWSSSEKIGPVTIVYSGASESADDYIIRCAHKERNKEVLLVSADRDLQQQVAHFGVVGMRPDEFYPFMNKSIHDKAHEIFDKHAPVVKTTSKAPSLVDEIMQTATQVPYYKQGSDEEKGEMKIMSKTRKKDKKRAKIIDKL